MSSETLSYIKLGIAALLPVIAAVAVYLIDKYYVKDKLNYKTKQIIIGVIFGGLAVVGTEWGIPMAGAMVNARDAAVLTAGLFFGAPAGIIAGLIGGIERWFAVYWGVGTFTRVACSVSTIIAGLYAALFKKYMFENTKPGAVMALALGVVMEVFHLTMVFLTNMADVEKAMAVVKVCTTPMVTANSVSLLITAFVIGIIAHKESAEERGKGKVRISQKMQRWLLAAVLLMFALTSVFTYTLQDEMSVIQADSMMTQTLADVESEVRDASEANIIKLAYEVESEIGSKSLDEIAKEHDVAEIDVIDKNGIITDCTNKDFIGFDMSSGEQSAEFLCLLGDKKEYVQDYGPISFDQSISRKYAGVKSGDGFIQVAYDAEMFQREMGDRIEKAAAYKHVGGTGFVVIFDLYFNVASAPEGVIASALRSYINPAVDTYIENDLETFDLEYRGEACIGQKKCKEGYTMLAVIPREEAYKMKNVALYVNSFMQVLTYGLLFAIVYLLIKLIIVDKIRKVNDALNEISGGKLDVKVDVNSTREFVSLSKNINITVDALKGYIDKAAKKFEEDLLNAKNIQASALPVNFSTVTRSKNIDIFASMTPAKEVGGDFYDFYMTEPDILNILIADVSGKGISGSLFMMRAKAEIKNMIELDYSVDEAFNRVNNVLCEGNDAGMFVTAWQGKLNLRSGEIKFSNAGHNPPIIVHADGKVEYLKEKVDLVLAGMEDFNYREQIVTLSKGDLIYMYTDGAPEATNGELELFGEERLLASVAKYKELSAEELCCNVKREIDEFVGDADPFDDLTMMAVRLL